ncbi:MAG: acyl-CoA synthetase [Methylobacteriaceae bacterium]|nr:acyl-CoA synthetase [Methylobacteriaceae bacterium]
MNVSPPRTSGVVRCSKRVMNLAHFMRQSARRYADEVGFAWGKKTWTWKQLDRRVDAIGAVLVERGVRKGDRVLVQFRNCNQLFESMFACFRIGAVWVPTNFRQTPDEVAYLAEASGASAMICGSDFPEHARASRAAAPAIRFILSIGKSGFGEDYEALAEAYDGKAAPDADVEHDDPCWFFFTSGTTGRPKAAVLTHGQMGFVVTNHLCDLMPGTTQSDASLVVAPLSHGAGIHALAQVARGAKTVLLNSDRFDAEAAWQLIEKWRVSNMFTVPTILKMLAEHPAVDRYDHSSLRHVIYAGAPMYREDQKHALAKMGKVLVQYFGLGEVTGNITVLPAELHDVQDGPGVKIGTCGYERTGMQISIQDDDGRELPPNQMGEICVCGLAVFAGYYNNPEANAKAFRDGWFRTGDLGHVDEQGFLYITGRASDMYISGGSNIYPREIEEKILTHPAVVEVAVFGMPDRTWGEIGICLCVLAKGAQLNERELMTWLESKVARYKLPKRVFFWDDLPKTGYGKISKKLLRAELETRGCLETVDVERARA